jgi:hypothetical protein
MSKIKLNLGFPLTTYDGTELTTAGKSLGELLAMDTKNDPIKFDEWGKAFHKGETVELDYSDFKKLRDFVEKHPDMFNRTKAPILKAMDEAKEESKKPPVATQP